MWRSELRAFLGSRRARLSPEDVGLESYGTVRRVPGLRREELARLAGLGPDYYVRLEQGRIRHGVSDSVVDALARVLRLSGTEREHLYNLTHPQPRRRRTAADERVSTGVLRLLDGLDDTPGYVVGQRTQLLAWNRPASMLFLDFDSLPVAERNLARLLFLDQSARKLFRDWEPVARDTVARLHLEVGRRPWDGSLAALIGDLSRSSAAFEALWDEQDVTDRLSGSYHVESPVLGSLSVGFCALVPPGEPDQALYLFIPEHEAPRRTVEATAVARRVGRG
ncbi:helix-turn-helix transcriptional regulator [Streptomyces sp. NPDC059866]|uniref:helix-turn-helix transcriptional regulator n=1 Tax=Streptomyces sp. NPDC059866 TaxID=3346978 RepID=UPI00364CD255